MSMPGQLMESVTLKRRIEGMFEGVLDFPEDEASLPARQHPWNTKAGVASDVFETETQYVVSVDLPGIREDQLEVHIFGGELRVSGTRVRDAEQRESLLHAGERFFGPFRRSFALPAGIPTKAMASSLERGVLTVRFSKGAVL